MDLGALIGFNYPISLTWAPYPHTLQLYLCSGLSPLILFLALLWVFLFLTDLPG